MSSPEVCDKIQNKANEIISIYKAMTGRDVIPRHTKPERTYQWRYIKKFLKTMKDVPWETTKKVAYLAIEYAKENTNKTVWSRGLWILTKSDIIDIAYKKAKEEHGLRESSLQTVKANYEFAKKQKFKFSETKNIGGFSNVVAWYDNGDISLTYLAMSESCKEAMKLVEYEDMILLPGKDVIARRRIKCLIDKSYNDTLKRLMVDDYILLLR